MIIKHIEVGELYTNCYFLIKDKDVIVIDPGAEFNKIDNMLKDLNLIGVIITHYHPDHIGALKELVNKYNIKVYDYKNMKEGLNSIKDFNFNIIYTPGHTNDSITIYFKEEKNMFTGDFIFRGSIGRTDLGGNEKDMKQSILKIKEYPNVKIYPGHGEETSLDFERHNNIFFRYL